MTCLRLCGEFMTKLGADTQTSVLPTVGDCMLQKVRLDGTSGLFRVTQTPS